MYLVHFIYTLALLNGLVDQGLIQYYLYLHTCI